MQARTITASDFVQDFRAGIDDLTLMRRYGLTEAQLENVMSELSHRCLITDTQVEERAALSDTRITRAFVETKKASKHLD